MRYKKFLFFITAVFVGTNPLQAQRNRDQNDQLLALVRTQVLIDLETDSLNPTVPPPYSTGWVIFDRSDRAAATSFRASVLSVMEARPANASDTLVEKLDLYKPVVRGDSAVVHVDRGRLWCARGTLSSVGMIYQYHFRRSRGSWYFLRRDRGMTYDPPPPATTVTVSSCIPAYAR
jgi:hypothetical protein